MTEPITRRQMFGWLAVAIGTPLLCEAGAVSLEDLTKPTIEQQYAMLHEQGRCFDSYAVVKGSVYGFKWTGWKQGQGFTEMNAQYLAIRYDAHPRSGIRLTDKMLAFMGTVAPVQGKSEAYLLGKQQTCKKRLIHFLEQNT